MTDRIDPKAVVASLREDITQGTYSGGGYRYVEVMPETAEAAADTIDALVREMHARELHHFEEEQKSAGLAAEVERLRLVHAGQTRLALSAVFTADVDDDKGVQAFYREWMRNHDAALIESLADHLDRNFQDIPAWTEAYREGVRTNEWMAGATRMTMSAIGVIRERARQVREGEA